MHKPSGSSLGRNLRIVDQLATTWGAFEGTTHVWAELPMIAAQG
ncbi:MAG TPA: hypothetical protein VGI50_18320 [Solirubrobacteraceae bacterium]